MIAYKLTHKDRTTYGGFLWPEPGGEWVETSGEGPLCGPGWLHWYTDPILAVFINPIHANIPEDDMLLWEADVDGRRLDDKGLKFGTTRGRLMKQIEVPHITREERICVAIMLTKAVLIPGEIPVWDKWANNYLSNIDRSNRAAAPAACATYAAAGVAYAAANAAQAACATRAATYTADAAYAARAAAQAADLDLAYIIIKAIEAERKRVRGETNVQES